MIIDATDGVLGRIAAFAAHQAKRGEKIEIVNCEKAVITGSREDVLSRYFRKMKMGVSRKGPFLKTRPEMLFKKTIRGMLPYKQDKGKAVLERITCYQGIPAELKSKPESVKEAHVSKTGSLKYITIQEVCSRLKER